MDIKFLINSLLSLAIFVVFTLNFFKNYKEKRTKDVAVQILLIGLVSLVLSSISLLWFFGVLNYVQSDFISIYSILMLLQGFFIFMIIYYISNRNNKLLYLLFLYFAVYLSLFFIHTSFVALSISVYFLFVILISISLLFRGDDYRDLGIFGILYAGASLLLHIFVLAGLSDIYIFSIFYGILLLTFVLLFVNYLKRNPIPIIREQGKRRHGYLFHFTRNFIFALAVINLVFIGTIVIHEFGHLLVSYFYNCASREIVLNFAGGFADTQILCANVTTKFFVAAGGPVFPALIASVLILVSGKFLKEIGLLMAGFNFIMSYPDFLDMGLSSNFAFFVVIVGIIFAVAGIILLAKSKTEEYIYSP